MPSMVTWIMGTILTAFGLFVLYIIIMTRKETKTSQTVKKDFFGRRIR